MAYTTIQTLRKMRARNKGQNRQLAAIMRKAALWLSRKGPEEFSRDETRVLQSLRIMIDARLYTNATTKSHDEFIANPKKFRVPGGGYSIELNKKDL